MDCFIAYDTDIVAINRGKGANRSSWIIYRDQSGALHEIDLHACSLNYKTENPDASDNCVGERNRKEAYFLFYTSGIKTKILFKKSYVLDLLHRHWFAGSKMSRFHALQELLCETNYKTHDLS